MLRGLIGIPESDAPVQEQSQPSPHGILVPILQHGDQCVYRQSLLLYQLRQPFGGELPRLIVVQTEVDGVDLRVPLQHPQHGLRGGAAQRHIAVFRPVAVMESGEEARSASMAHGEFDARLLIVLVRHGNQKTLHGDAGLARQLPGLGFVPVVHPQVIVVEVFGMVHHQVDAGGDIIIGGVS